VSEQVEGSRRRPGLDQRFEVGLADDCGLFPTRRFAEAVAGREVRNARTT
jgi:hypothetical protein